MDYLEIDKNKIIYPSHYRRAINFADQLFEVCNTCQGIDNFEISDNLQDKMKSMEESIPRKKSAKRQKLWSIVDRLEARTAEQTVISLVADSQLYNALILLCQDADDLFTDRGGSAILNNGNRIFGNSEIPFHQLISEYSFWD